MGLLGVGDPPTFALFPSLGHALFHHQLQSRPTSPSVQCVTSPAIPRQPFQLSLPRPHRFVQIAWPALDGCRAFSLASSSACPSSVFSPHSKAGGPQPPEVGAGNHFAEQQTEAREASELCVPSHAASSQRRQS